MIFHLLVNDTNFFKKDAHFFLFLPTCNYLLFLSVFLIRLVRETYVKNW